MLSISPRIVLASAISLLILSACNSDQQTKSASVAAQDAIEATVNGIVISKSRVDMIAKQAASAGQPDSPEARKAILDQLVMQTLVADEAVKKGLDKSEEVTAQIDLARQSILSDAYVESFVKTNPVTDDTLTSEYERLKSTLGNEYKARHILVEKEAEAKEIISQLQKNPGAFGRLAKEKSKDKASGAQGGDLGWFDPRRMAPEFGAAVQALDKGKFTDEPVVTSYGYHVIALDDSRPLEAPPLDRIKAALTQQIQQQALIKHLDELKAKARIAMAKMPDAAPKAEPAKTSAVEAK